MKNLKRSIAAQRKKVNSEDAANQNAHLPCDSWSYKELQHIPSLKGNQDHWKELAA
jgi:hypothetical protein